MKSSWVEQEPVQQTLTEHLRGCAEWKFEGGRVGLNTMKEAFQTIRVPKIRRKESSQVVSPTPVEVFKQQAGGRLTDTLCMGLGPSSEWVVWLWE